MTLTELPAALKDLVIPRHVLGESEERIPGQHGLFRTEFGRRRHLHPRSRTQLRRGAA